MRHLLQPRVLNWSVAAALVSALACYPRLSLWQNRTDTVWSLEFLIFFCSIVLWGFVFAWHAPYTQRPVFVLKINLRLLAAVTLAGIAVAAAHDLWLDPLLRSKLPEEYPPDRQHWLAQVLFSMFLNQLFLVFAPFDWLMRLAKKRWLAAGLTVVFGTGVFAMRIHSLPTTISPPLLIALFAGKIVLGFLMVWLYLRGGVFLVWWWTLLLESRHLLNLTANA